MAKDDKIANVAGEIDAKTAKEARKFEAKGEGEGSFETDLTNAEVRDLDSTDPAKIAYEADRVNAQPEELTSQNATNAAANAAGLDAEAAKGRSESDEREEVRVRGALGGGKVKVEALVGGQAFSVGNKTKTESGVLVAGKTFSVSQETARVLIESGLCRKA